VKQLLRNKIPIQQITAKSSTRRTAIGACIAFAIIMMLLFIAGSASTAWCQAAAYMGTITGIVTDPGGAVVPDAAVVAINTETGVQTRTTTNSVGAYQIPNIAAGTYNVEVTAKGFAKDVKTGVLLDPNGVARADCSLTVGATTATVTVTEAAPLLETQQTTLDQTIQHAFVENLPNSVNGGARDITALLSLVPGVTQGANGFETIVEGGRAFATEVLVDGVPANYNPLLTVILNNRPPQDVVSEVQVQTGVPTAQWGHSSGTIASFTTRAGTDQYHGDAVLILRNTLLDARPYNSKTKTTDQQWELPMSIGGPIRIPHLYNGRDKSFFFFNYTAYRIHSTSPPYTATVPTKLERDSGNVGVYDFSQLPANVLINDPVTGKPFLPISSNLDCATPGRCIPASRVSPFARMYLSQVIPQPTNDSVVDGNFTGRVPSSTEENHYFARIDQKIGQSHTLSGSLRWDTLASVAANGPFNALLSGDTSSNEARTLNLADAWILRPNLTNSLQVSYARWLGPKLGTPASAFPHLVPGSYSFLGDAPPAFPFVNLAGAYSLYQVSGGSFNGGATYGYPGTFSYEDPFWNGSDTVDWQHGKHSLKFGVRFEDEITQQNISNGADAPNGEYNFQSYETGGATEVVSGVQQGDAFASFLLGEVDSAGMFFNGNLNASERYYSYFGQDNWRVTPTFTLDLGMRWDISEPFNYPNGSTIDPTIPNPGAGNIPGAAVFTGPGAGSKFFPTWHGGFGPRVGFAWNVMPNTVVRAGYGIMFEPAELEIPQSSFPGTSVSAPTPGSDQAALQWDTGWGINQVNPYRPGFKNPNLYNGQNGVLMGGFSEGQTDRQGYIQDLQFDVQQSVGKFLIGASYMGQLGHKLIECVCTPFISLASPNQLPVSDLQYGNTLSDIVGAPGTPAEFIAPYSTFNSQWGANATVGQSLRAFPQFGSINSVLPLGNSTYHAGIFRAESRDFHGLQLIASFTVSKNLTDSTTWLGYPSPQDQFNRKFEKSVAPFSDIPQILHLVYNYQLPIGSGKPFANQGAVGRALEGFEISANQYYESGSPITITSPSSLPIYNGYVSMDRGTGSFTTGNRRSVKLVGQNGSSGTTYLNSAAFALPTPVEVTDPNNPTGPPIFNPAVIANPYSALGNLKRVLPNVRNLGYFNEDLALYKNQTLWENVTLHIGFDMINAVNRKNFGGLDTNISDATFGKYFGNATNPRVVQIDAKLTF